MPILKPQTRRQPSEGSFISTVVLHGRLAEFSPDPMPLPVVTAAGVIRAMVALKPGFAGAFREGHYRLIRGDFDKGFDLDETMLDMRTGGTTLHLLPVAEGAKSGSGIGKIVVGAVVLVATVASAGAALGFFGAGAAAFAASAGVTLGAGGGLIGGGLAVGGLGTLGFGTMALFGASILLSGISTVLSAQPKKNTGLNNNSYGLGGRTNVTTEGSPIPVIYGRTLVGSTVISIGYNAEDLLTNLTAVEDNNAGSGGSGTSGAASTGAGGSSGKGSGGTGSSGEANNTLQSDSVVRIIDVLGEGQVGLVNGAQSIYFNNTPLQAEDGTYNFQGVNWDVRTGLPDQDPVAGYPSAENTVTYGNQVINADGPLVQNITSDTADAASVTLEIPALYSVDTTTSYIGVGPDLSYMVEVQAVEGAWTTVVDTVITGQKCTSPYYVTYRFDLPGAGSGTTSWNIRVTRLTADNTDSNIADDLYWASYNIITDHQLIYPDTAYVALTIDAASFGSQIPTRTYEVERLDVQVPLNFNAVTRTYSSTGPGTSGGTWDGVSWQSAVTDDPCWCLLDMLTNTRFGVGLPASVTETTAYDLYTISQYCNGTVPDGFGGTEPRYTLNVVISSQTDAYSIIQNMVSAFRGMTYWGSGSVVVAADMPADPIALVTQANTANGEFSYEGTGLNTRHNMARVTWINPGNYYQQAVEVVEDFDNIALRGIVPTDLIAFGCQSRGLANRLGRWLLDTEQNQTQTLSHTASFDQINVRPGDVFAQADPYYAGARMGGRIRSGATQTVVSLDAYLATPGSASNYTFCCQLPDGTLASEIPITGFNTNTDSNGVQYTTVTLGQALAATPDPDAVYIIISTSLAPQQWRCLGMTEASPGVFQLVSLQYDPNKFARVEDGLNLTSQTFSILPALLAQPLPPPSNVSATSYMAGVGTTTVLRVTVSWSAPSSDPRVTGYQISANSSSNYSALYTSTSVTIDIDNLPPGDYVFGVRTTGTANQTSAWVYSSTTDVNGVSGAPDAPGSLSATGGTRRIQLNWDAPPQRDILNYEVWRGNLTAYNTWLGQSVKDPTTAGASLLLKISATSYTDNDSANLLPLTTWYYWVRAITTTLAQGAFAGPADAETTDLVADSLADGIINTAAFAEGITPVVLIGDVTETIGSYNGEIAYDEASGSLYKWDSAGSSTIYNVPTIDAGVTTYGSQVVDGEWDAILQATTTAWFDSITAGIASFGGLKSAQIAAGAIQADQLASETLLTESAQIGNLVVGTSNLQYNSATSTSVAEADDTLDAPNGEVIALPVTTPDSGVLILFIRLALGSTFVPPANYGGGDGTG